MLGDLMGQMEERQKELKSKLAEFKVESEAGNGAVKVTANANREILNISINKDKLDWSDPEQIEDMLLVAINRALEKATQVEAEESQKLMKDMLPPGLGGLFG